MPQIKKNTVKSSSKSKAVAKKAPVKKAVTKTANKTSVANKKEEVLKEPVLTKKSVVFEAPEEDIQTVSLEVKKEDTKSSKKVNPSTNKKEVSNKQPKPAGPKAEKKEEKGEEKEDAPKKRGRKPNPDKVIVEKTKKVVDTKIIHPVSWNGFGVDIDGKVKTMGEIMELGKLNWNVKKDKVQVASTGEIIKNRFAIIREDTGKHLGTVGNGYEIIQNSDIFNFFNPIIGTSDMPEFQRVGSIYDDKSIFITAKMKNVIKVRDTDEDTVDLYTVLSTTHDGSGSIICMLTPIRVQCNNQLNFALKQAKMVVKIKHTKNASDRLDAAKKIMLMYDHAPIEMKKDFDKMAATKISDDKTLAFIASVMSPAERMLSAADFKDHVSLKTMNLAEEIMLYAKQNDSQLIGTAKGTIWGAYNAITGYYQNVKEYGNSEEKFNDLVLASNSSAKTKSIKAYDMALSLI